MPAIAGMSKFRSCCLPCRMTPPARRNSMGRAKLKKAALGLRQNMCRSKRYWRQVRATASGIGGQLQVDVLERRPAHAQLLQALAPGECLFGELVQGAGGIVGVQFHELTRAIAVGNPGVWSGWALNSRGGPIASTLPSLTIATRSANAWASSR